MRIWNFLDLEYGKSAKHTSKKVFLDNKQHEEVSRTSMCTAQSSSLGRNKLVPSRIFCPKAVARGLAEEEK
jgi:hypothetical protein